MGGAIEKKEANVRREIDVFVSSLNLYSKKYSISSLRQKIARRLFYMIKHNSGKLVLSIENCKKVKSFLEKYGVRCKILSKGELGTLVVVKKIRLVPKKTKKSIPLTNDLAFFFKGYGKKPNIELQDIKAITRVYELIKKNEKMNKWWESASPAEKYAFVLFVKNMCLKNYFIGKTPYSVCSSISSHPSRAVIKAMRSLDEKSLQRYFDLFIVLSAEAKRKVSVFFNHCNAISMLSTQNKKRIRNGLYFVFLLNSPSYAKVQQLAEEISLDEINHFSTILLSLSKNNKLKHKPIFSSKDDLQYAVFSILFISHLQNIDPRLMFSIPIIETNFGNGKIEHFKSRSGSSIFQITNYSVINYPFISQNYYLRMAKRVGIENNLFSMNLISSNLMVGAFACAAVIKTKALELGCSPEVLQDVKKARLTILHIAARYNGHPLYAKSYSRRVVHYSLSYFS